MKNFLVRMALVAVPFLEMMAAAQSAIDLEPASAALRGPFLLTNNCICQNQDTTLANGGRATFKFAITNAGDYVIRAQIEQTTSSPGSFFVNIDNEPKDPEMVWEVPGEAGTAELLVHWKTEKAAGIGPRRTVFQLSPGEHQVFFVGRSAHTKLGRISLLQLPAPPRGLRLATQTDPAATGSQSDDQK